MRRILCLYLPNWPIQRLRAALRHQKAPNAALPAVVMLFARDPRRGEIVVAASETAAAAGVRLGMPLAEAAALAERTQKPDAPAREPHQSGNGLKALKNQGSPVNGAREINNTSLVADPAINRGANKQKPRERGSELSHVHHQKARATVLIEPRNPAADLAALARLAEHCERFSPIVGWETVQSSKFQVSNSKSRALTWNLEPGTWNFLGPYFLLLDITGIGVLFGGEENLASEVVAHLAHLGYEARVAVAGTVGAAWGAARQGLKLADYQVSSWSLDALRLPRETIDLLSQLGIAEVGQVLALPRESLRARFGEQLLLAIDQVLGTAPETIVAHRAPPQFVEEQVLEYPEERADVVAHIIRELVRRIARELAARREGVVRLAGRLDCAPGQPLRFEVGLFRPSADEAHLWDLVRMQLEQHPLPGAVGRVRIEALLTAKLENRQGLLFAGDEHEAQRQLALFIDRCTSRLGTSSVLVPELTADPLPEKAVRYRAGARKQRFRSQGSGVRGRETGDRGQGKPVWRPVVVCSPAVPLRAVSIAPDGPPVSFELEGRRQQVIHHEGPERIEAGWWRGATIRRDYWRVETAAGARYWLFRDLASGQWHLHGQFA